MARIMEHGQVLEYGGVGHHRRLAHKADWIKRWLFGAEYFMCSGRLQALALHKQLSVLNTCVALFAML